MIILLLEMRLREVTMICLRSHSLREAEKSGLTQNLILCWCSCCFHKLEGWVCAWLTPKLGPILDKSQPHSK